MLWVILVLNLWREFWTGRGLQECDHGTFMQISVSKWLFPFLDILTKAAECKVVITNSFFFTRCGGMLRDPCHVLISDFHTPVKVSEEWCCPLEAGCVLHSGRFLEKPVYRVFKNTSIQLFSLV